MHFNIRGENIEVTPAIREYIEKKVGKLERYFDTTPTADVNVKLQVLGSGESSIEVTIPMPKLLLRGEEINADMYAAIDIVVEKLERQIRKYKTKVNRKFRQEGSLKYMFKNELEPLRDEVAEDDELEVVRTKRFNLKPMDAEEAILQMDLLGHNFFVFSDAESGSTNVVYRRKDGKYGLIEPEA
ncbi:ribosome-associated translation inhibitor RaiA [Shouchella clausii]|uniref:Ribosome hibernation promoting factor n=3 Tax=Shouchella TaxID=2893057 RepID=Q5WDF7_SHOC1|nr:MULTISPECIES: ribosome-associated translation inhibitor RaiA [Shouchella]MCM3313524.1 ribosome-associated translation inhibitor RaiA [Psychrobacillus sp. MER TA 17]ALA54054.1 Ribosomal subunit interface protein [Shouchella clausii]KKI87491.1 sigma-54 modulation protein [Shouchella clausii]MBU3229392.1 ribosome-associated translation inhibitor RaiA [Shouchella clausii]MBU3265386.1 ribosome-associated translation inhibitor RaiA [Shouchella clausii]